MLKCSGVDAVTRENVAVACDSVIRSVDPVLGGDTGDTFIAPGFIDLQVNGFAGVDFNSPAVSHAEIQRAIDAIFSTGVTRFFPTVITGDPAEMLAALRNLAAARESLPHGEAMAGFHVEGPHISPEDGPRGAHPRAWVRPPDFDEFLRWQDAAQDHVRMVTLAPEWPGAPDYIERITETGVVAAIGHTRATAAQIRDAVSAGATLSTHLGNGAGSKTRTEEFIAEQLNSSRLAASFIVDPHHLPDEFLSRALHAKGVERSLLVTDAAAPAMCPPGPYVLGGVDVELKDDGRVVLRGGTRLAGSSLRMDHAIANVMARAGLTLAEAITMATTNPARVGRVGGRLRGLQPGSRADLVRFRFAGHGIEIQETYLSGQRVF
ncbi:MAG: N-acetylglucosamine-6-phosphate deacetylase [Bryobacterales bacterium]|nr:N-acetylglucosamine-6-phosphate deacetylase [Bryobacterales bacterium]